MSLGAKPDSHLTHIAAKKPEFIAIQSFAPLGIQI